MPSFSEIKLELDNIEFFFKTDKWKGNSAPEGIDTSESLEVQTLQASKRLLHLARIALGDEEKQDDKISVKDFREKGYLQELNRRFLHPLGMALQVTVRDDGQEFISGIWDQRNDPEGIIFDESLIDVEKAKEVEKEFLEKSATRKNSLGYIIQPLDLKK
jgi:hypothetical protein